MKTQFETEKEAEAALDKAKGETLCWCPVIKQDCRKDCGCYDKGNIRKDPFKDQWRLISPHCINPLVCGVITVE